MPSAINYVLRTDISHSFETWIANELRNEDQIILGFPGVGKSTSAKAIAALYRLNGNPSIYLKFGRSTNEFEIRFEFVILNKKLIPVPIIEVPSNSIETEEVQKSIASIKNKLHRLTDDASKIKALVESAKDHNETATKIKELLEHFLTDLPKEYSSILEFGTMLADSLPYISTILKIFTVIGQIKRDSDLRHLEKQNLLIVLDDLEDLRPNWIILSNLLTRKFRFLYVKRIESAKEYLSLPDNRSYSNEFLKSIGVPRLVKRRVILPLPSLEVFGQMMTNNGVSNNRIEDLWKYSGGIPAIALMIWISTGSNNIDVIIDRIKSSVSDKSLEIIWNVDDVKTRLDFALDAAKAIYKELRSQNYAYVALVVQPAGVSSNELALFCGCIFGEICSCNNANVQNLIDLLGNPCCPGKPLTIKNDPCSTCTCSFELNESLVQTGSDSWYRARFENGKRVNASLPSMHGGDNVKTYGFNNLFQHIPLLLHESALTDEQLRTELEQARRALLQIIARELHVTGVVTLRTMMSAIDHIDNIRNLDDVSDYAVSWMVRLLWTSPGFVISHGNVEIILDKVSYTAKNADLKQYSRLLPPICHLYVEQYSTNQLTSFLMSKVTQMISELITSEDRVILFYVAHALAMLEPLRQENTRLADTISNYPTTEPFVRKLCEINDSICAYSKIMAFSDMAPSIFSKYDYGHARQLFAEAEKAIEELNKISLDHQADLSWMFEMNIDPEITLFERTGKISGITASLDYYLDDLQKSIEGYSLAASHYNELHAFDSVLDMQDGMHVSQLMLKTNDEDAFHTALHNISEIDKDILGRFKEDDILYLLLPDIIARIHVHAVFARASLNYMFNENHDLKIEPEVLSSPMYATFLYCGLAILKKLSNKNFDLDKIITNSLDYYLAQNAGNMALSAKAVHIMQNEKLRKIRLDDGQKLTLADAKSNLMHLLDDRYRTATDQIEMFTKPYRELEEQGMLVEAILVMASKDKHRISIFIEAMLHLLFNRVDLTYSMIININKGNETPIEERISREFMIAFRNFYENRNKDTVSIFAHDILRKYIQFWYHNCA